MEVEETTDITGPVPPPAVLDGNPGKYFVIYKSIVHALCAQPIRRDSCPSCVVERCLGDIGSSAS